MHPFVMHFPCFVSPFFRSCYCMRLGSSQFTVHGLRFLYFYIYSDCSGFCGLSDTLWMWLSVASQERDRRIGNGVKKMGGKKGT